MEARNVKVTLHATWNSNGQLRLVGAEKGQKTAETEPAVGRQGSEADADALNQSLDNGGTVYWTPASSSASSSGHALGGSSPGSRSAPPVELSPPRSTSLARHYDTSQPIAIAGRKDPAPQAAERKTVIFQCNDGSQLVYEGRGSPETPPGFYPDRHQARPLPPGSHPADRPHLGLVIADYNPGGNSLI